MNCLIPTISDTWGLEHGAAPGEDGRRGAVPVAAAQDGELLPLQGLLPICAWCKKTKNEENYWERVDTDMSARSRAQFTHGIRPECQAALLARGGAPTRGRAPWGEAPAPESGAVTALDAAAPALPRGP